MASPSPPKRTKPDIHMVTVSAPTNIAVIKYWGKASVEFNTPLNDSVSVTLHQDDMRAVTTVAASPTFTEHRLWLNGEEKQVKSKELGCIQRVQALATDCRNVTAAEWKSMHVHISSYNTFPTAAGLASSAAGYAALVAALAELMQAKETFPGELSTIARQGSGSACRSLHGGLVAWRKGSEANQWSDSKAEVIAPELHWPEMRALILVVSDAQKHTSSTLGMTTSVNTSLLLQHRASVVVPQRMEQMQQAWTDKNFDKFATLTMQDSNQFHAVCLDTYPPIFYMNDVSRDIIRLVTKYNEYASEQSTQGNNKLRVAYTFDAGPNAVLYCLDEHVNELTMLLKHYFFPDKTKAVDCFDLSGTTIQQYQAGWDATATDSQLQSIISTFGPSSLGFEPYSGKVKHMYLTRPGPGPREVADVCNLDPSTGLNVYSPSE
jgi:diphosphomevalonate decarboxylase